MVSNQFLDITSAFGSNLVVSAQYILWLGMLTIPAIMWMSRNCSFSFLFVFSILPVLCTQYKLDCWTKFSITSSLHICLKYSKGVISTSGGSEKLVFYTTSTSSISFIRQRKLHLDPLCDVAGTTYTSASPLRDICKRKLKDVTSKFSSYPTRTLIISGSSPGAMGLLGTACSFLLLTRSNSSSDTSKSMSNNSPSNRINNSASVSVFRLGFF